MTRNTWSFYPTDNLVSNLICVHPCGCTFSFFSVTGSAGVSLLCTSSPSLSICRSECGLLAPSRGFLRIHIGRLLSVYPCVHTHSSVLFSSVCVCLYCQQQFCFLCLVLWMFFCCFERSCRCDRSDAHRDSWYNPLTLSCSFAIFFWLPPFSLVCRPSGVAVCSASSCKIIVLVSPAYQLSSLYSLHFC